MAQLRTERDPVQENYSQAKRSKRWKLSENYDIRGLATAASLLVFVSVVGILAVSGTEQNQNNLFFNSTTTPEPSGRVIRIEGTAQVAYTGSPLPEQTPTPLISLRAPTPDNLYTPTPQLAAIQNVTRTAIAVTATHRSTYAPNNSGRR